MSLRHVLATASVLLVTLVATACSNQGEGERCDRLNNDEDCQEGLVCTPATELGSSADTCCPEGTSELPECTHGGGAGASTGTGTGATSSGATVPAATVTSTSTGDGGGGASGDGGGGASSQGGGGASPGSGGAGGN